MQSDDKKCLSVSITLPFGWNIAETSDKEQVQEIVLNNLDKIVSLEFFYITEDSEKFRYKKRKKSLYENLKVAGTHFDFEWLSPDELMAYIDGLPTFVYLFKECQVLIYVSSNAVDPLSISQLKILMENIRIQDIEVGSPREEALPLKVSAQPQTET